MIISQFFEMDNGTGSSYQLSKSSTGILLRRYLSSVVCFEQKICLKGRHLAVLKPEKIRLHMNVVQVLALLQHDYEKILAGSRALKGLWFKQVFGMKQTQMTAK